MSDPQFFSIFFAVFAGVLATYYFLFRRKNYFEKHGIHHKKPAPIFGNMAPILFGRKPISKLISEIYEVHPDAKYVGMFDFQNPVLVIRDPELIKSITIKNFDNFPDHRVEAEHDPMMDKNLVGLKGERWRTVRATMSPVFTSAKMKTMFKLISSYANDFCEFISKLPEDQREMDVKDSFTRYTNDIVASCAFGVSIDSMRERNNDFYTFGIKATKFTLPRMAKAFVSRSLPGVSRMLGWRIIDEPVSDFFTKVVAESIKTRDEQGIKRPDMIEILMETRGKEGEKVLSAEEMAAQAFVFFFAGFETVSNLMSFTAHHLAVHPEVQKRLQEEIDEGYAESKGTLTYEAVSNMKYMDAVINEVLRLYPLASILDRECVKDFQLPPALPGGKPYTVKAGSNIWIPLSALQRDPKYFENPDTFDPDRFLTGEKEIQNSGTYMPFGMGPRMCIGLRFGLLETKVLLCNLLSRCNLIRSPKTSEPLKLVKLGFFTLADGGYWMKIQPRSSEVNGKL